MKSINKSKKIPFLSKLTSFSYSKKTKSLMCGVAALVGGILTSSQGANASIPEIDTNPLKGIQLGISDTKVPGINETKKTESIKTLDKNNNSLIVYKIKWGDTLGKLSSKFKVSIDELAKLNKISNPNLIYKGDTILIPNNIGYNGKNTNIQTKTSKSKIKLQTKPVITKDKKNISNDKQITNNITIFDKELIEKTFILNKKNFEIIYSYAKIYHKKSITKILALKDSNINKKRKIVDLYFRDEKCFNSRISVKKINNLKLDNGISSKVKEALKLGGYNITASELLKTIMKVESSGGAYINFVKLAFKTSDNLKKELYIKKAIDGAVGFSNDCGPFNITPIWIYNEIGNGGVINGKIEQDINKLRQKLKIVFEKAVEEKLNESQIMDLLKKVDVRFDIEQMSPLILNSFVRIHGNLKSKKVSNNAAIKGTIMAYNIGEGRTYQYLKKDTNLSQTPKDTEKKLSFLNIANIKNNTIDEGERAIKKENIGTSNNEIARITDYYPKAVKIITSNIKDENARLGIQKKLGENPIDIIDKSVVKIREEGTTQKKSNILNLFRIRNKIEEISLQEFKKAA